MPAAGAAVTVAADRTVLLDVSPPPLAGLTIEGALVFDEADLALTADWIAVTGTLRVGTTAQPFQHQATITLTGSPDAPSVMGMGNRVLGVNGGTLDLHGEARDGWTRLAATAPAGASQLQLEAAPDWRAGDKLVVASTDFDPARAEVVTVASRSGSRRAAGPAAGVRPLRRGPVDRRQDRGRAGGSRAPHPQHRHSGRQRDQRERIRRPPHGHGRHPPGRGRRAPFHGPEGAHGPVSDALAHDGAGGRAVFRAEQRVEELQPLRDGARQQQRPGRRQCVLRPPGPRVLPRGRGRDRQPGGGQSRTGDAQHHRGRAAHRQPRGHLLDHQSGQHDSGQRGGRLGWLRLLVRAARLAHGSLGGQPAAAARRRRCASSATTWPTRTGVPGSTWTTGR